MSYTDYINELARKRAERIASTQKNTAKNTVKGAVQGFMKGGPVGAIIGAGKEIIKGAKEKGKNLRSSGIEMDKAMMEQGKVQNEELINEAEQQNANNQAQLNNIVANSNTEGMVTGGASPVFMGTNGGQANPSALQTYQQFLRDNKYSDDVVNGVSQGLNSGYKEIDDWIKQHNQGAEGQKNPINIPKTDEEIALAREGKFNIPNQQEGGVKADVKQSILDKFLSGLGDFSTGYQENSTTKFKPENLQPDNNKSVMNRVGEFAGTLSRLAQNPLVQGGVAYGVAKSMGNPNAIPIGYKYAQDRARTNALRDVLAEQGINYNPGIFGNLQNGDVNAMVNATYKDAMIENAKTKALAQLDRTNPTMETFALSQLASGNWDEKQYNNFVNSENYIPTNRLSTNAVKAMTDKNYKEKQSKINQQNANSRSQQVKNSYALGKERNEIYANKSSGDAVSQTIADIVGGNDKKKKIYSF